MQDSSSRKNDHRIKTKDRPLKRKKAKLSDVWKSKNDPLDLENPESQLTTANIKNIITEQVFRTLPSAYQNKLVQLLPICDRVLGQGGTLSVGPEALNNEFFTKACSEWKERLVDGEFTADNQIRYKLEREKKLHVDPWKKKYFESFWGEKLTTSTTTTTTTKSMTVSSPVLSTSVQPSLPAKRPLLANLLTSKEKQSPPSAAVGKSGQQVREQLVSMLNNRYLPLTESHTVSSNAFVVGTSTAKTTIAAVTTEVQPDQSLHAFQTLDKPDAGIIKIHVKGISTEETDGLHGATKPIIRIADQVSLGKRIFNSEEQDEFSAKKRAVSTYLPIKSTESAAVVKCESASSLRPVLANALLETNNRSTTSRQQIQKMMLIEKPTTTAAASQTVTLKNLPQTDSNWRSSENETNPPVLVLHERLHHKVEVDACGNRVKSNLFESEHSNSKCLDSVAKNSGKLKDMVSPKHDFCSTSTLSSQSGLLSNSSSLNSCLISNSFLGTHPITSEANNSCSYLMSSPLLHSHQQLQQQQQQLLVIPSANCHDTLSLTSAPPAVSSCNNIFPGVASQHEAIYILQPAAPTIAVANRPKQSAAVTFPNQTPVILLLGSPTVPIVAAEQVSRLAVTSGTPPRVAVNNQMSFSSHVFTGQNVPTLLSRQTLQTLLVAKQTISNQTFQTLAFTDSASQNFKITNPISNMLTVASQAPQTVVLANQTSVVGGSTTLALANPSVRNLPCAGPGSQASTSQIRPKVTMESSKKDIIRPLVFADQRAERLIVSNREFSSVSQVGQNPSKLNRVLCFSNKSPKDCSSVSSVEMALQSVPLNSSVITGPASQLIMAVSGSASHVVCAAKDSVGMVPSINQLSSKEQSPPTTARELAQKVNSGSVLTLRLTAPSSTANKVCQSTASLLRCCNMLQSTAGSSCQQPNSLPLLLIQPPLSKAAVMPSETLLGLNVPTTISPSSMFVSPGSVMVSTASRHPVMFHLLPDGIKPTESQKVVLTTFPVNGCLDVKLRPNVEKLSSSGLQQASCSLLPESICSLAPPSVSEKPLHTLNGSRVKTIMIKKVDCAAGSQQTTSTMPHRSLIKTLLTLQEPEQCGVENSDLLNPAGFKNRTMSSGSNSMVPSSQMHLESIEAQGVCRSCGTVIDRSINDNSNCSRSSQNLLGICAACHSLI